MWYTRVCKRMTIRSWRLNDSPVPHPVTPGIYCLLPFPPATPGEDIPTDVVCEGVRACIILSADFSPSEFSSPRYAVSDLFFPPTKMSVCGYFIVQIPFERQSPQEIKRLYFSLRKNNRDLIPRDRDFFFYDNAEPIVSADGLVSFYFPIGEYDNNTDEEYFHDYFHDYFLRWESARRKREERVPYEWFYQTYGINPRYLMIPYTVNEEVLSD